MNFGNREPVLVTGAEGKGSSHSAGGDIVREFCFSFGSPAGVGRRMSICFFQYFGRLCASGAFDSQCVVVQFSGVGSWRSARAK